MNTLKNLSIIYTLGAFVRVFLHFSQYASDITTRVEVTTPLNGFYRVVESLYRQKIGVDPYSSDVLHESPVHLYFYKFIIELFGEHLYLLYVCFDLITAHCLYLVARQCMFKLFVVQKKHKHEYSEDMEELLVKGRNLYNVPFAAAGAYLLNPYSICNNVALTTTVISNLLYGFFFLGLSYDIPILALVSLALSTSQSLYPIVLISPLFLSVKKRHSIKIASVALTIFFILMGCLLYVSRQLYGSWKFLEHTYGFILTVPDQQPNVGVFWYFFMEMFEHFRLLFIYSFQINVTILYFVPLSIKFRAKPIYLSTCFVMLISIFKSYPCVGDFAFTTALLPIWSYLYHCMQQCFISNVAIVITTALAPVLWNLWICWGTANANFYFGVTLAFITANIFLVTDLSFGVLKYEYLLKEGNVRLIDGKRAKLVLE